MIATPHPVDFSNGIPSVCGQCGGRYIPAAFGDIAASLDPVHEVEGRCAVCKAPTAPRHDVCDACGAKVAAQSIVDRAARLAAPAPVTATYSAGDVVEDESEGGRPTVDMSPEAKAARDEAKRRQAEALAYVAGYRGTWGLPLDVRANPKWGTKHMRLSDRQVEVLLAGKARDAERATQAVTAQADPRQVAARTFLGTISRPREGFEADMVAQAAGGRPFTPGQLGAIERWSERVNTPAPAAPGQPAPVAGTVTEGMYRGPDGTVYKVQKAVHGSGNLYAKRLVVDGQKGTFEYAPGIIRNLRPDWRMSLDEAKTFGKLYGLCCKCGATLTDEKSIAAGIGPICAEGF